MTSLVTRILLIACWLAQPFVSGTLNVYCYPGDPLSCHIEVDPFSL